MRLKIAGVTITKYREADVNLIYDSIASTFSFQIYFDPNNASLRAALQPGKFPPVTIEHNGELLLTGTLLSYRFKSSAKPRHLVAVSGYSKTGVLEDCQIPESIYPLVTSGLSFTEIVTRVIQPFGLSLVIDPSVQGVCSKPIDSINADTNQTVKSYFADIAGQLNVVVSHTPKGEVLLTGYKTKDTTITLANYSSVPRNYLMKGVSAVVAGSATVNRAAVAHFTQGMPGVVFDQLFDGQKMHSSISVFGQMSINGGNAAAAPALKNPYCGETSTVALKDQNDIDNAQIYGEVATIPRPKVVNQTTGTYVTVEKAQRNVLSDELKALPLKITMRGWALNGTLARPGDIVTVNNPELHIYKTARFFIESANYRGNHVKETCELNCVVPETFNNDTPVNIFI